MENTLQISQAQKSLESHITLLESYLKVSPDLLLQDENMALSTLWHSDIYATNLFVNESRITSLIVWQASWAGPLILQARHSRLPDN